MTAQRLWYSIYTILPLAPRWARGRKTFLFASQNDGNWRALRSIQRVRWARGVGAQRPFLRVNQPKKTGARSARARTRGQNPLVHYIGAPKPSCANGDADQIRSANYEPDLNSWIFFLVRAVSLFTLRTFGAQINLRVISRKVLFDPHRFLSNKSPIHFAGESGKGNTFLNGKRHVQNENGNQSPRSQTYDQQL
jgi:hypothetical protein